MIKITISEDQNNIQIQDTKHVFVAYEKTMTMAAPCDHCSLQLPCEMNPNLFPCCEYEREDGESGLYKLAKD